MANSFLKADTYRQFKNREEFKSYLADIKNRKLRVTITEHRLSDQCLMIEKGRHKRSSIPREERFCPFYLSTVEIEIRFLTQCIAYNHRNKLFNMIRREVPTFANLDNESQFIFLMSQENKQLNLKLIPTIHKWLTERLEHNK